MGEHEEPCVTLVCLLSNDHLLDHDYCVAELTLSDIEWILTAMRTAEVLKAQDADFQNLRYTKYMFDVTGSWEQLYDVADKPDDFIDDVGERLADGEWLQFKDASRLQTSHDIDLPTVCVRTDSITFAYYAHHGSVEYEATSIDTDAILEYRRTLLEARCTVQESPPREPDVRTIEIDSARS